jgi:hypothetical protein
VRQESCTSAPLLDRLMARGHANLVLQGINIPEPDGKALQDWSRLETIYRDIATGIVNVGTEVNQAVAAIRAAKLPDTTELSIVVKQFSDDLERFTDTLVQIHNRHQGQAGPVIDANLLALYLSCGNDYTTLYEQFRGLVFPAMETITDYTLRARTKLLAEQQAEQLTPEQDPNVITDVEVKEVKQ